ncbi:hypothetical protein DPMN_109014 [Dreissena polymorpha]|uniref:Uncharacterized protein n=1 Tax=Dreissena polymorpha TaxID=45954 RepID=A0A9D4K9T6_DREPO|nr:hypothetical protein DPMN_109014 [Dreissena polymorpha]
MSSTKVLVYWNQERKWSIARIRQFAKMMMHRMMRINYIKLLTKFGEDRNKRCREPCTTFLHLPRKKMVCCQALPVACLDTNGDFGEDHQFFQAGWSSGNPKFIEPLCLD